MSTKLLSYPAQKVATTPKPQPGTVSIVTGAIHPTVGIHVGVENTGLIPANHDAAEGWIPGSHVLPVPA